jgi:hypothetical protein
MPESVEPAVAAADNAADPVLSVVKGHPTPEELAALTAVVLSLGQGPEAAPERPGVRHWVRRQQLRLAPKPGPDAWRRSLG